MFSVVLMHSNMMHMSMHVKSRFETTSAQRQVKEADSRHKE